MRPSGTARATVIVPPPDITHASVTAAPPGRLLLARHARDHAAAHCKLPLVELAAGNPQRRTPGLNDHATTTQSAWSMFSLDPTAPATLPDPHRPCFKHTRAAVNINSSWSPCAMPTHPAVLSLPGSCVPAAACSQCGCVSV